MSSPNQMFATCKPSRLFLRVAMPGMISMLAMSLYSILEGMFIGQILGEAAFAAVNVAMPFVMINFSLSDLVAVGSSVPISVALGRQDNRRANNYFTCGLLLIFFTSILMGTLLFTTSPWLVRLMGAEGDMAILAVKYIRVYALMSPVTTVIFAMDNYLRICGFVKLSMGINILMTVLTVTFLALFLIVLDMNVEGSALATSLSMTICVVLAFIPFLCKKTVLTFVRPHFSGRMLREIVSCGTPIFLNNIAGRVAAIVMNIALLRMGGEALGQTAVAAYAVLMYAGEIIQPLLYGMSDSVQPAIGYNWGAGSLDRVKSLAKCAILACGVVSLVGTAVMFCFPEAICSLFVKPEEEALMAMAVPAMRLFATAYLFRWLGFAVQGFYSAIEKPLPASILSVCNAMVLPVLFIVVLAPLGLDGLWLNMTATSLVIMIMALVMLRLSQRNLRRDIAKKAQHSPD